MVYFQEAYGLAQNRKVLIDFMEEYENAFVFSYSKGANISPVEFVVVMKETGLVSTFIDIKKEELGKKIGERQLK